jgi:hypothetical protein
LFACKFVEMRIRRPLLATCSVLFLVHLACGNSPANVANAVPSASARLDESDVARVGGQLLPRDLVVKIASEKQGVSGKEIALALVDEALLAQAADSPDRSSQVAQRIKRVLARRLAAQVASKIKDQSDISDAELAAVMGKDWVDLQRPEMRNAVHVVVRSDVPDGDVVAKNLREALDRAMKKVPADATEDQQADEFTASVNQTLDSIIAAPPTSALKSVIKYAGADRFKKAISVEKLSPFTLDGRVYEPDPAKRGQTYSTDFTKPAFALPSNHSLSNVVKSEFGHHVMWLLSIQPPFAVPRETIVEKLKSRIPEYRFRQALAGFASQIETKILASDDQIMALPILESQ